MGTLARKGRRPHGLLETLGRFLLRLGSGEELGPRSRLNLIAGSNVTISASEDTTEDEIAVTIASTGGGGGSAQGPLVYSNTSVPAGNTVSNTTTLTDFASTWTIPAGLLEPGDVIRMELYGWYLTAATAPPPILTIHVLIAWGGTPILDEYITLDPDTGEQGWSLETQSIVFEPVSSDSSSVDSQGVVQFGLGNPGDYTEKIMNMTNSAAVAMDLTIDLPITISVEWSAADSSNIITLRNIAIFHYPAP